MSNLTLNDITSLSDRIVTLLRASDGELTPEIEQLIDTVDIHLPSKIDSYSFLKDRVEAEVEICKTRSQEWSRAGKSVANVWKRLKSNIKYHMIQTKQFKLQGTQSEFSLRKSKDMKLKINKDLLPNDFKESIQVTELHPDETKIKQALAKGVEIPGVTYEYIYSFYTKNNLTRINK